MLQCGKCSGTMSSIYGGYLKCDYCGVIYSKSGDNLIAVDKAELYERAVGFLRTNDESQLSAAAEIFDALGAYKDSGEKAYECKNIITNNRIAADEKRIEEERQQVLDDISRKKREFENKQRQKAAGIFGAIALTVFFVCICIFSTVDSKNKKIYDEASEAYAQGNYDLAVENYSKLKKYKDSQERVLECQKMISERNEIYDKGVQYYESGQYVEAIQYFDKTIGYEESTEYINRALEQLLNQVQTLFDSGDYEAAKDVLAGIPEYSDAYQQINTTVKDGYVQEVIAVAQSIVDNKEEQLHILEKGCQLLGNEPTLVSMRDEIQAEVDDEILKNAEGEIGESYKSGGYSAAIEKARELSKANPRVLKIKELEEEYTTRYTEKTLEDIDSIYKANGVGEVVATLKSVYNITNDAKIKNEISLWQKRISSVKLTDIESFHEEKFYISEKIEEDNWGNTYSSHFYVSNFGRSGYVEYNVKNIDEPQLQFVYYVPRHIASILSEGDSGWKYMSAKVYGDDMEIWSSGNANQKMEPQLVRLDVSEYSIVKIYISGVNDGSMYDAWSCHIGDMQFCW